MSKSKSGQKTRPSGGAANPFMLPTGIDLFGNMNGLNLNIDDNVDGDDIGDVDDDELERELMALQSNKHQQYKRPKPAPKKHELQDLSQVNIDKLLKAGEDDDADIDDGDLDIDDDDLESELAQLQEIEEPVKKQAPKVEEKIIVEKRQTNVENKVESNRGNDRMKGLQDNLSAFKKKYESAVSANDSGKVRRFKRVVEQYNEAIKACQSGSEYDYEGLPTAPELLNPSASTNEEPSEKIAKQAPAPPVPVPSRVPVETPPVPKPQQAPPAPVRQPSQTPPSQQQQPAESDGSEAKQVFKAPPQAKTTLEALEQLNAEFQRKLKQATEENDGSKKRRYQRFVKQIGDAINATKAGKDYEYGELEPIIPPGFGPIPLCNGKAITNPNQKPTPAAARPEPQQQKAPQPPTAGQTASNSAPHKQNEQALKVLIERQKMFKEAALQAKHEGNDKIALLYLRNAKGFDNMITAAQNGLPVDLTGMPKPPQMTEKLHQQQQKTPKTSSSNLQSANTASGEVDDDWEVVDNDISGDRNDIFKQLESDLRSQIKVANGNAQFFTNIGDVANATKFRNIEKESAKDLNGLIGAFKHGDPVPKYHYEKRRYQSINTNTELTDNDLEIEIVRGINYPLPPGFDAKSLQTFVKFEFPYPTETPQSDKTNKQSGNNPDYNQSFKIEVHRKQNKFLRLLNRKEIKFEIYYKAGFLKGDKLLGTASCKLQPLEEKCTIHDAFDLFDGRKQLNGKIEVRVKVREPFVHKEVKTIEEKWLVIDKFITGQKSTGQSTNNNYFDSNSEIHSLEVLNFDRNLIERQIETYKERLNKTQLMELMEKSEHLNQLLLQLKERLKAGGKPAFTAYVNNITSLVGKYDELAKQSELAGDTSKASLHRKRKELVQTEITKIKSRLG